MVQKICIAVLALFAALANADAINPVVEIEIAYLFSSLEQSDCAVYRNGTWYDAKQASAHLHKKYDYLRERQLVSSTESFIEQAATQSSMSGQPYQVRCSGKEPLSSSEWFRAKLAEYRASKAR